MKTQKDLIAEFETNIEVLKFKYENLFKISNKSLEDFLQENYQNIRSEFAKTSTDILYLSIINNISDQDFLTKILTVHFENVYKLLNELKK